MLSTTPRLAVVRVLTACVLVASAIFTHAPLASAADEPVYDLVIYGGTSGGVATGVQARRMGKTAVLIEPTQHLGGLTTGGLGATDIGNKGAIGGVSREFYQRIKKHYADTPIRRAGRTKSPRTIVRAAVAKRPTKTRCGRSSRTSPRS